MKGYRCEDLFGDGVTDPVAVAIYETFVLGNMEIPLMLLANFKNLTEEDRVFLETCNESDNTDMLARIVRTYIGERDYCKWLCASPEDIWHCYVEPLENNRLLLPEFLESGRVSEYSIPDDAVVLADLGREGTLYCWEGRTILKHRRH